LPSFAVILPRDYPPASLTQTGYSVAAACDPASRKTAGIPVVPGSEGGIGDVAVSLAVILSPMEGNRDGSSAVQALHLFFNTTGSNMCPLCLCWPRLSFRPRSRRLAASFDMFQTE
jgi:hypothetical protein